MCGSAPQPLYPRASDRNIKTPPQKVRERTSRRFRWLGVRSPAAFLAGRLAFAIATRGPMRRDRPQGRFVQRALPCLLLTAFCLCKNARAADRFAATGSLNEDRAFHTATRLLDGRVL